MASILTYLNNILQAVYGKDVRQSIHDGIQAINSEVEGTTSRQNELENIFDDLIINAGSSNAEIVAARGGFADLDSRLDDLQTNKADKTKTSVWQVTGTTATEINNALYYAYINGIQNVYLPRKDTPYQIDKELIVFNRTRFFSNGAVIQPLAGSDLITAKAPMVRNYAFNATGYDGDTSITIEGLVLDCNSSEVSGLALAHTSKCVVKNCLVINFAGGNHGMDLCANKELLVENNVIVNGVQSGIQIDQDYYDVANPSVPVLTAPTLSMDNTCSNTVTIRNNKIYDITSAPGIHLHKQKHKNIFIENNYIEDCMLGVSDDVNYNSIHENLNISNNTITGGTSCTAIALYAGVKNAVIHGNICTTGNNGILLMKNDNSNQYYGVKITNNTTVGAGHTPILVTDGFGILVEGNTIGDFGDDVTKYSGVNITTSSYVKVLNNRIYNTSTNITRYAIESNTSDNIDIVGNSIVSVKIGYRGDATSKYVHISNNTFRNMHDYAVFIESSSTIMSLIKITDNIIDATGNYAIRILYAKDCVINNNTITNVAATYGAISLSKVTLSNICSNNIDSACDFGIAVSGNTAEDYFGLNVINSNVVKDCTTAIAVLNYSKNNIVVGNMIKNSSISAINTTDNTVEHNRAVV